MMLKFFASLIYLLQDLAPVRSTFAWTEVTSAADWRIRMDFASVVFDNKIYMFCGFSPYGNHLTSDVWSSGDGGTTWTEVVASAPWASRYSHSAVVLSNAIYIMGGKNPFGVHYNDV